MIISISVKQAQYDLLIKDLLLKPNVFINKMIYCCYL